MERGKSQHVWNRLLIQETSEEVKAGQKNDLRVILGSSVP